MKQSLRRTPSHLHLAYRHGEASDSLLGRNFSLGTEGRLLTLGIDLAANFHTRNKNGGPYLDAVGLATNHRRLRFLQCSDNLVRSRLIRAWERVENPQLHMCLDLGERGHYVYSVKPHSLFMGGVQLDVLEFLDDANAPLAHHFNHHLLHGSNA